MATSMQLLFIRYLCIECFFELVHTGLYYFSAICF